MKYTEVPLFKEGMPEWLYEMSEKERLKIDFDVSKDGKMCKIKKQNKRRNEMKIIMFVILLIVFSIVFGYMVGYPTTKIKDSCSSLNSSLGQYQCEAINNPTSHQGIEYFGIWILLSPLLLIMIIQVRLIGKAFEIMLFK